MSRVRNADEFLLRFRRISYEYERNFGPVVSKLCSQYTSRHKKEVINDHLEVHARTYFVNALLAALNWRLDKKPTEDLPNLVPELSVRPASTERPRFLDYLGFERGTGRPLLIVETKRPRTSLPRTLTPAAATYSEIVSRGLAGKKLIGEWNKWLDTLRVYVRSVYQGSQEVPRRVVITNGDWLILFLDPADAFLEEGEHDPCRILVFQDRSDIEKRFTEIFRYLEHQQVLREVPPLTPGELPFYAQEIDRVMHGLRLRYIEVTGIYQREPMIRIAPVIWLRTRYGAWLRVESPGREYQLARGDADLRTHLNEVRQAAQKLLAEVNKRLGTSLQAYPLTQHYEDEYAFAALPGVQEQESNDYLLVTGNKTHYLLQDLSVSSCPYHDWPACQRDGVPSNPRPLTAPSVSPRSFFVSGDLHHCAHRDVSAAKASLITAVNRARCGPRSGSESQAFCEIWCFEQYLCCRTCAYEEVCTKAPVFRLPCQRPTLSVDHMQQVPEDGVYRGSQ